MSTVLSSSAASVVSPTSPQADQPAYNVALVAYPDDWQPAGVSDVPPNVEVCQFSANEAAAAFTRLFNERETNEPSGRCAIGLQSAAAVVSGTEANVEVHPQPSAEAARIFAENFNRLEMAQRSSGRWAIGPVNAVGEQSVDIDATDSTDDDCESLRETDDRQRPDEFDAMFPGLPVVITAADGTERAELLPDPRAAFARHIRQYGDTVKDGTAVKVRTTAVDPPATTSDSGLMRLAAMGSVPMK